MEEREGALGGQEGTGKVAAEVLAVFRHLHPGEHGEKSALFGELLPDRPGLFAPAGPRQCPGAIHQQSLDEPSPRRAEGIWWSARDGPARDRESLLGTAQRFLVLSTPRVRPTEPGQVAGVHPEGRLGPQ